MKIGNIKKIDMYRKSQRQKATWLCPLYADDVAFKKFGHAGRHVCDAGCQHDDSCDKCIHQLPEMVEKEFYGLATCGKR